MRKRFDENLWLLLLAYFVTYTGTGIDPKVFTGGLGGVPKITQMTNLVYATLGGITVVLLPVIALRWWRHFTSAGHVKVGRFSIPKELFLLFLPAGLCTAVIIPTTTMMYSFHGLNVMLAVVMMRGCIVVIGRVVDAVQIRQGILKKEVAWEENVAVVFALAAVCLACFVKTNKAGQVEAFNFTDVGFDFIYNPFARATFLAYIIAYAVRLYVMGYYKNTLGLKKRGGDNRGYFAMEQLCSNITIVVVMVALCFFTGSEGSAIAETHNALRKHWDGWVYLAILGGTSFGLASFPSVFIFLIKGKTSTFAALANRLTSLIGGTFATLIIAAFFHQKTPKVEEWLSLALVLVAVGFLVKGEKRQSALAEAAKRAASQAGVH